MRQKTMMRPTMLGIQGAKRRVRPEKKMERPQKMNRSIFSTSGPAIQVPRIPPIERPMKMYEIVVVVACAVI